MKKEIVYKFRGTSHSGELHLRDLAAFNKKVFEKNIQEQLGIATQDTCFYNKLTVKENVEHFARLYGLSKKHLKQEIGNLLRLVNLYSVKDKLAEELSGGMQKRIDIACAMIHSPKVIILDEPTSDLDYFLRQEMLQLIKLINDTGITVIAVILWERTLR